jgi:hypothetical protein
VQNPAYSTPIKASNDPMIPTIIHFLGGGSSLLAPVDGYMLPYLNRASIGSSICTNEK